MKIIPSLRDQSLVSTHSNKCWYELVKGLYCCFRLDYRCKPINCGLRYKAFWSNKGLSAHNRSSHYHNATHRGDYQATGLLFESVRPGFSVSVSLHLYSFPWSPSVHLSVMHAIRLRSHKSIRLGAFIFVNTAAIIRFVNMFSYECIHNAKTRLKN